MDQHNIHSDEIDLRRYIMIILRRWRVVACLAVGLAAAAFFYSTLQPPVYTAETTILLKESATGGRLSQFAGLAGMAGINLSGGSGNVDDITQIIRSRAVAEKVLRDLKLRDRIKGWDNPKIKEQNLISMVRYMLKKPKEDGNLIDLKVEYSDPVLAAEIANGFTDALSYYWNELNYTEARKKREYIESQLPRVELGLRRAEQRFKQFTLLSPKSGATATQGLMGGAYASQYQGIEMTQLSRELEIQNTVYTMLRKEYESTKLEESIEIAPFSVIDRAETPMARSKPNIKMGILTGLAAGIFLGIFVAFFQEYWEKSDRTTA